VVLEGVNYWEDDAVRRLPRGDRGDTGALSSENEYEDIEVSRVALEPTDDE